MTPEQESALFRSDYQAWLNWKLAQPGKFATEAEARGEAERMNRERIRDNVEFVVSPNRHGGWDVAACSND